MLSVQRNTQVKCTNNPVCHCDWQNPLARADLSNTCIYVLSGTAYTPQLTRSLSKPLQPFPVFFSAWFNKRRGAHHSAQQPASFPLTAQATEKQLDLGRLWLTVWTCLSSPLASALLTKPWWGKAVPTAFASIAKAMPQQGTGQATPSPKCLLLYENYCSAFSSSTHHFPRSANSGTCFQARSRKVSLSMTVSDMCMDNENRQSSDGKD